jgi:2-phosphosulfolactate phosphatase
MKQKINVCLSLSLIDLFDFKDSIVVVIDVLRATTAICEAFKNGASKIIPVADLNIAKQYKKDGYIVAAERDGNVLDFADFGNSPHNFTKDRVENKTVVYSTVNGVPALFKVKESKQVLIASFINLKAIVEYLTVKHDDILIVCAGWKGNFNLEDTILAGAIIDKMNLNHENNVLTDSTKAAIDLWKLYANKLLTEAENFAQIRRLRGLGIKDKLEEYFTMNSSKYLPIYVNDEISILNSYS